jgi:hypothetical protein
MGASDGPILPMPKPYSRDLGERAIESIEAGASRGRQTAMELAGGDDLGAQTWKTTGNIVAKSHCDMPLECESIYLSIGADVETVLGSNQRLEMMKPGHCMVGRDIVLRRFLRRLRQDGVTRRGRCDCKQAHHCPLHRSSSAILERQCVDRSASCR